MFSGVSASQQRTKTHALAQELAQACALLRRSAGLIPASFRSIQRPKPGRLGKLKHVDQSIIVDVPAPASGIGHFSEHSRSPIRISYQGSLVVQFRHPGLWYSRHHSALHHQDWA